MKRTLAIYLFRWAQKLDPRVAIREERTITAMASESTSHKNSDKVIERLKARIRHQIFTLIDLKGLIEYNVEKEKGHAYVQGYLHLSDEKD